VTKGEGSPISKSAERKKIEVYYPKDNKGLLDIVKNINPEIIVVVSYGTILPKEIIEYPRYGAINVHGSLLPLHRGASPITASILEGDKMTGITIQKMAEEMDRGDILFQEEVEIDNNETKITLENKLIESTNKHLSAVVSDYIGGKIVPLKQDNSRATYSQIIEKKDGHIDFTESAEKINRKVRAYTPWPSAYAFWGDKMIKILEAEVLNEASSEKPGTFIEDGRIVTGKGILKIKKIQLEGKKPMDTESFLLGNDITGNTLS